jgi:hypothetical protein
MVINVNRFLAKPILFIINVLDCKKVLLVCKGYGDDYELYTELCWEDDKGLDLFRDQVYQDFKLWF